MKRKAAACLAAFCAVAIVLSAVSCMTAQMYFAKAINLVLPKEKSEDLGAMMIKLSAASYTRPRPLTIDEQDMLKVKKVSSYAQVAPFSTDGNKFIRYDGKIEVNGSPFVIQASNAYFCPDVSMAGGVKIDFTGSSGKQSSFKDDFKIEKLELTEPKEGASLDLSTGFKLEWNKGSQDGAFVRVLATTVSGFKNITTNAIAIFPDSGSAFVSPAMLTRFYKNGGRLWGPGTDGTYKLNEGPNTLIVERYSHEPAKDLGVGSAYEAISGDCVAVNIVGSPPIAPDGSKEYKSGKVDMQLDPDYRTALSPSPDIKPFADIRKIAVSYFTFSGMTAYKTSSSSAVTTHYWRPEEADLNAISSGMAKLYATSVAEVFGANVLDAESIKSQAMYKKTFRPIPTAFDWINKYSFTTSADGLGLDPDEGGKVVAAMPYRDHRLGQWLELAKESDVDLFLGGTVDITRNSQGNYDPESEFEFTVTATLFGSAFSNKNIAQAFELPRATAQWTSDRFDLRKMSVGEFLKHIGFDDFVECYVKALKDMKAAN